MPKPTLTEIVRAVERSIVALEWQVRGIEECEETGKRLAEEVNRLTVELAALREKVAALEKLTDQFIVRRWTMIVALISASAGGLLTFVAQLLVKILAK